MYATPTKEIPQGFALPIQLRVAMVLADGAETETGAELYVDVLVVAKKCYTNGMTEDTYNGPLFFQVRMNPVTLTKPVFNELICEEHKDEKIIFTPGGEAPPNGVILNPDFSMIFAPSKLDMAALSSFNVTYSLTNFYSEKNLVETFNTTIEVTYGDLCSNETFSAIEVTPIEDMEISVLGPSLEQTFEAFPTLFKDDTQGWNAGVCGDMAITVTGDSRLDSFITLNYE